MEARKEAYKRSLIQLRLGLARLQYSIESEKLAVSDPKQLYKDILEIKISIKQLEERLDSSKSEDDLEKWTSLAKIVFTSISQKNTLPVFLSQAFKSIADQF
ncbi:MAG: hypothetical protein ACP5LS_03595 [Thermoprotei archaeon]